MRTVPAVLLSCLCVAAAAAGPGADPARRAASPYTGLSAFATFDSFASQCYAIAGVSVTVGGPDPAGATRANVGFDFPPFYKPTWGEVFDHVARQVRCRWAFDPARNGFLFVPTDAPPPFGVTPAPGWRREDRGLYVWHAPADQPFGLDVYDLGHYTAGADVLVRVRDYFALRDVARWPTPPTMGQMSAVKVAGADALYLRTDTPRPGGLWRQWSVVVDGHAYLLVSAMPKDREAALGPAVDKMVASFGPTPPAPATGPSR